MVRDLSYFMRGSFDTEKGKRSKIRSTDFAGVLFTKKERKHTAEFIHSDSD